VEKEMKKLSEKRWQEGWKSVY